MGLFTKEWINVAKAVSDHDLLPDWVRDLKLRAFTSIATAVPITNRICALRGVQKVLSESRSERALHSEVLRIRLSRRITFQNVLFSCLKKNRFERALHSLLRVKSGFQIRKGSESRSETAFGMRFTPLWTGPISNNKWLSKVWNTVEEKLWKDAR